MAALSDVMDRDVKNKASRKAREALKRLAANEAIAAVGVSNDGKTLAAVGDARLLVATADGKSRAYPFHSLHSVSTLAFLGDSTYSRETVLLAPQVVAEPFDPVELAPESANRIAEAVRTKICEVRKPGDDWWDNPAGTLGTRLYPAGMLIGPPGGAIPNKSWCSVSMVNTGVQIRTAPRLHTSRHPPDARVFLPWDEVREVAAEGVNQVQQRPSVGAVLVFGLAGLAARRKESRSYLTVSTTAGDYVFQVEGLLLAELAAKVSTVTRNLHGAGTSATDGRPIDKIRQLAALRDEGILTAEEFEAKKAELLKQI